VRGADTPQTKLFTTVSTSSLISAGHSLRQIREMVNRALKDLSAVFNACYSTMGRPSMPPKQIFRALIIQIFRGGLYLFPVICLGESGLFSQVKMV